ncbi:hypothetical protein C2W64_03239 [Brevibacillus laterosporus]|nr:hypothetical protein [Brevibacillus laterosporus]RAP29589.1 hypothetical protein C2W64_03239 [Brevibacillus laterosporus]
MLDPFPVAVIATSELDYAGVSIGKNKWERFPAFTTVVMAYLLLTSLLSKVVVRSLEKKYSPS